MPSPPPAGGSTELDEAEKLRIANMVERIRQDFPWMTSIMRNLIEAGFARGWRDIEYFGPQRPDPPGTVSCADMHLEDRRRAIEAPLEPNNKRRR